MNPVQTPRRLARAEAVLATRRRRITLVLEDPLDHHNISAVLRTCEAFGLQDVHLVARSENPLEINSAVTLGAERWLTVQRHAHPEAALDVLRGRGYRIHVGHLAPGAVPLTQIPRDTAAAYVFGSERHGVSPFWLEHADLCFRIPTTGFTGSLNLSVAAALVVYDRSLSENLTLNCDGDLAEEEKAMLRPAWYESLAHGSPDLEKSYRFYVTNPPSPAPHFPHDRNQKPT